MKQPRPWLDEVIDAMGDIDGEGTLSDIYSAVGVRKVMVFGDKLSWEATIRNTIERHASQSDNFTHKPEDDFFLAPRGLNTGYWAIRGFSEAQDVIRSLIVEDGLSTSSLEAIS